MPISPTYPGVYIEEVPSGVRTITGVATSITAFVGRALRGPVEEPVRVQSFGEFARTFGGLWRHAPMSYAVQQYFENGGADASIVRLERDAESASVAIGTSEAGATLDLVAASPGAWGNRLRAVVDHDAYDPVSGAADADRFNLVIDEMDPATNQPARSETFRNLTFDPDDPRFVTGVLLARSELVRVESPPPAPSGSPPATARPDAGTHLFGATAPTMGSDGDPLEASDYQGDTVDKKGIFALEKADLFNILCIPPMTPAHDVEHATWSAAANYCRSRRAMLVVDPPFHGTDLDSWANVAAAESGVEDLNFGAAEANAAAYFPRIRFPDPLNENRPAPFAPCGAVAGLWARTDASRGVWKAPAGQEATLSGAVGFDVPLTDGENGRLNPLGLNCLRTFSAVGHTVWGARTLKGDDRLASEWKYVPVRRLALFIEESLYRGTQWVVFEPNDEPLWSQIRLNVGTFMQDLFRQGAFQGSSPREAFFVKCDSETTTQSDIDRGIVNILVGFAPLKPAEFVIIKISQMSGQEGA